MVVAPTAQGMIEVGLQIVALIIAAAFSIASTLTDFRNKETKRLSIWGRVGLSIVLIGLVVAGSIEYIKHESANSEKAKATRTHSQDSTRIAKLNAQLIDTVRLSAKVTLDNLRRVLMIANSTSLRLKETQRTAERSADTLSAVSLRDSTIAQRQEDIVVQAESISRTLRASVDSQRSLLKAQRQTVANTERLLSPLASMTGAARLDLPADSGYLRLYSERVLQDAGSMSPNEGTKYIGRDEWVDFDTRGRAFIVVVFTQRSRFWPSREHGYDSSLAANITRLERVNVIARAFENKPAAVFDDTSLQFVVTFGARLARDEADNIRLHSGQERSGPISIQIERETTGRLVVRQIFTGAASLSSSSGVDITAYDIPDKFWWIQGLGERYAGSRVKSFSFSVHSGAYRLITFCASAMTVSRLPYSPPTPIEAPAQQSTVPLMTAIAYWSTADDIRPTARQVPCVSESR